MSHQSDQLRQALTDFDSWAYQKGHAVDALHTIVQSDTKWLFQFSTEGADGMYDEKVVRYVGGPTKFEVVEGLELEVKERRFTNG